MKAAKTPVAGFEWPTLPDTLPQVLAARGASFEARMAILAALARINYRAMGQ